jgi:DNA segregation ATPase FtsK/SpoIIIE-like protein
MKNLFKLPVLVLGLILLLAGTTQKAVAQDYDVSLQTFYDELSPYGTWIQDREYGYVWRPDVDQRDFRPYYTDGRWVMTEYGNTWVSDYDWGWAPFHYGRWVNNRYNEWVWIPDTVWGPAWVSWRSGGGYYGWAPLGPGININVNFGGGGGYYDIPHSWWVFVPQRNIYYDRFPRYRGYGNVNIYQRTTIINYVGQRNNHNYYTGPRRDDIRRATNRDVPVYNVNRSNRAGRSTISNNTVNIYNPRSSRGTDNNSGRTPAPRTVVPESTYSNNRTPVNRGGNANTRNNTESRANRTSVERGTTRTETTAAQRAERTRQQTGQAQPNRNTESNVPTRTQRTQRAEQSQVQQQERERQQQSTTQAQAERSQRVRQAQAQQQERGRQEQVQQQAQERSRQQQAQAQQQAQERSRQQQAQQQQQQQERSRQQQQSAPRPQVQQQNNESRGGGEATGGSRSSRSNRG